MVRILQAFLISNRPTLFRMEQLRDCICSTRAFNLNRTRQRRATLWERLCSESGLACGGTGPLFDGRDVTRRCGPFDITNLIPKSKRCKMPALQGMAEEDEVYDGAAAPCAIFPILFRNPRVHGSLITYSSTPNATRARGLKAHSLKSANDGYLI